MKTAQKKHGFHDHEWIFIGNANCRLLLSTVLGSSRAAVGTGDLYQL